MDHKQSVIIRLDEQQQQSIIEKTGQQISELTIETSGVHAGAGISVTTDCVNPADSVSPNTTDAATDNNDEPGSLEQTAVRVEFNAAQQQQIEETIGRTLVVIELSASLLQQPAAS